MNTPIKTNQIKYSIDFDALNLMYDVFVISTSENHFKNGAYIIDSPLLCNNVCSVFFDNGSRFYVLMYTNIGNKRSLNQVVCNAEGGQYITISQMNCNQLSENVLLQLLLNSMADYISPLLRFNNLTGHFYCFNPEWLVRGKVKGVENILKVPCLELRITKDLRMNIDVHTFTSALLKKQITFQKKKYESYPKYIFSANQTLRRKLKDDTEQGYILRQTDGDRTVIPFLDIQGINQFAKSKMGILAEVISCFNNRFKDIVELQFADITDYNSLDYTTNSANESKAVICRLMQKMPIKIVDCIGDDYSAEFCNQIKSLILKKHDIKSTLTKRVFGNSLNIRIIHNKDYYLENNDPHNKKFENKAVQHITFEDFSEHSEFAISTVINEMLIKNDLVNKKISLFDWQELRFTEDVTFGICVDDNNIDRYFFMTIHTDGTFEIFEQKLNLFNESDYDSCMKIFDDAKAKSENMRGIVKDSNGNINIIKDTDYFTIPQIFKIKDELTQGNTKLRNKLKRDELLSSCLDIKYFSDNNSTYYFVGTIGSGMRPIINNAANIRKIEPYMNSTLFFERLVPLMSITFVNNGRLTIIPFPFKYLQEYVKTVMRK